MHVDNRDADQAAHWCSLISAFVIPFLEILGECLLTSSLPGKALRTLVESRGLPSDSTCILKAGRGKLDIKRHEPGILLISLQVGSLFKLAVITYLLIFMSIQRH